jgi:hypothetical protein
LDISSGDDVFLLQAFNNAQKSVRGFVNPKLLVTTPANNNFLSLLDQRRRWAGKNSKIKDPVYTILGLLTVIVNLGLILMAFVQPKLLLVLISVKGLVDLSLLMAFYTSIQEKFPLKYYILFVPLYPFYLGYLTLSTLLVKSSWKGRLVHT